MFWAFYGLPHGYRDRVLEPDAEAGLRGCVVRDALKKLRLRRFKKAKNHPRASARAFAKTDSQSMAWISPRSKSREPAYLLQLLNERPCGVINSSLVRFIAPKNSRRYARVVLHELERFTCTFDN